jgi:hypothetical protein
MPLLADASFFWGRGAAGRVASARLPAGGEVPIGGGARATNRQGQRPFQEPVPLKRSPLEPRQRFILPWMAKRRCKQADLLGASA